MSQEEAATVEQRASVLLNAPNPLEAVTHELLWAERLRDALVTFATLNGYDGRFVILCDDGSVVSDDEPMDGDVILVDRENGRSGDQS